jgi:hypothetical protein
MREAERQSGVRLLDVVDIHWYPQSGAHNRRIIDDHADDASQSSIDDPDLVQARLDAPRSLWDPAYDEHSWVSSTTGGPVRLLRRLHEMIDAHYPGTRLAVTEYYFGRGDHISGGIAQADALGIFGRENVFAAALWPGANIASPQLPGSGVTAYAYVFGAFKMFLNYDGAGGRFGDTGIAATTSDSAGSSIYGSLDPSGHVVLVAINKLGAPRRATITVRHGTPFNTVRVFTMTNGSPVPESEPPLTVGSDNTVLYTMPAMSVTTMVFEPQAAPSGASQ